MRRGAENPWWLLGYAKREWAALSLGSLTMTSRAMVLLALPWPLKSIIDNVIFQHKLPAWLAVFLPDPATHRLELLNILGAAMLALGGLDALLVYAGARLFLNAGQRIMFAIRFDLFAHLQRLSLAYHRQRRGGELTLRLSEDVRLLQDFVASIGNDLLPHAVTILGMAAVMLAMDWRYALLTLAVMPVLLLISVLYGRRLRAAVREQRRHDGGLSGLTQEILAAVQLVQSFAREPFEDGRFGAQAGLSMKAGLRANGVQSQYGAVMSLAIGLATGLIAWFGAASVLAGRVSAGELLVFLAYLRGFAAPARQLAKSGRIFSRAMIALERVGECRAQRPSVVDPVNARLPESRPTRMAVRAVRFGYEPGCSVLHDISFQLQAGRSVALVGKTGAGKSSVANLLMRFYDPNDGAVLLDDVDIRALPLAYLRKQVVLVSQDAVLLQGSVWENIAYGREGAGRDEAMAAAAKAGVAAIIERLPNGFDTKVSERGQSLSGGQRQCIAIARATLCDAPVVVLDEPSSSLDAQTEQQIMAALQRLASQRAALIIAHRLTTIMHADEILVLEQGRVVERGGHAGLLAARGAYAALWQAHGAAVPQPRLKIVNL